MNTVDTRAETVFTIPMTSTESTATRQSSMTAPFRSRPATEQDYADIQKAAEDAAYPEPVEPW